MEYVYVGTDGIVSDNEDNGGFDILGIFSTQELAEARVAFLMRNNQTCRVEQFTLDPPVESEIKGRLIWRVTFCKGEMIQAVEVAEQIEFLEYCLYTDKVDWMYVDVRATNREEAIALATQRRRDFFARE